MRLGRKATDLNEAAGLPSYEDNREFSISPESSNYTIDAYGTEDYIYILWDGNSMKDSEDKIVNSSKVIVLDWNGNYIKSYQIPDSFKVAANPSNTVLFTISIDKDDNPEVRWYNIDL